MAQVKEFYKNKIFIIEEFAKNIDYKRTKGKWVNRKSESLRGRGGGGEILYYKTIAMGEFKW